MGGVDDPPVEVHDVCYRRVDGLELLCRVYRPRGPGPFPAAVGVHGGVWTAGDRTSNVVLDRALARSGVVVAALDVRKPPVAGHPASAVDVREGMRWLRARAADFGADPERMAAVGTSSGGHLVLLALLGRDGSLPPAPAVDVALRGIVLCWPVVDPAARYRWAQARGLDLVIRQLRWFGDEATMEAANPQRIVDAWTGGPLPPTLLVQGSADGNLPAGMAERFVASYRAAGGAARVHLEPGAPHSFVNAQPESAATHRALTEIVAFVHAHTGAGGGNGSG